MQNDLFNEAPAVPAKPPLTLQQHESSGYQKRTAENARGADVTVAFAADFTTAGEKLTKNMAGAKYVGIPYGTDIPSAVRTLLQFLSCRNGTSLNIAGNGIYTLSKHGISQHDANLWVLAILKGVHARKPLSFIRSGGQTGIDTAGLVAGLVLGVPVLGLYPFGFRQRLANGRDTTSTAKELEADLRAQVAKIQS
ncbi:putative molybdenum carrier protein [Nostoc sp. CHAB 5834]|nr:putative molybdenum carrier protein [Nostoc sp. CHAB 5834]